MDETLALALASPGKLTNFWGKSGAGKTIVAMSLALAELEAGGKVIYLTDEPRDVAAKLAIVFRTDATGATTFPSMIDNFLLVRIRHFANQTDMIEQLPFAFLPPREFTDSPEFKNFVENAENYINESVVKSFEVYQPPTMVVVDEFTRLYKHQATGGDLGELNPQLALQLGFLKTMAQDKGVKVVLTSSSKTILENNLNDSQQKFIEVPIINELLEYYTDIDAQITWTGRAGERAIEITGRDAYQGRFYVDLADLHKPQNEVS